MGFSALDVTFFDSRSSKLVPTKLQGACVMRKYLAFLLLTTLFVPALSGAATSVSKDYEDQGLAIFNKGLYAKSIDYFQSAVQADSSNWQAYEDLGNAYAQTNQNQNAIDAYQHSLQGNPNNQTVRDAITNLGGNPNGAPVASTNQPAYDQGGQTNTVVVQQRIRPRPTPYADGLPLMDHARIWTKFELGYNYAALGDLFSSATTINGQIAADGVATGLAKADNSGIMAGAELGFLLDPNNGIALGVRYVQTTAYTSNLNLHNGGDFEDENFQPYLLPITLDYYFFLPDKGGRFFITGGVGYYASMVHGEDNYSYDILSGGPATDDLIGDVYGGTVGFQLGVGREFAISDHLGLELFARGRYARITELKGTVTNNNGDQATMGLMKFSDGSVHLDNVGNIGGGENFATLDYTGFDVGLGLTFF